jgi:hypothetical protein
MMVRVNLSIQRKQDMRICTNNEHELVGGRENRAYSFDNAVRVPLRHDVFLRVQNFPAQNLVHVVPNGAQDMGHVGGGAKGGPFVDGDHVLVLQHPQMPAEEKQGPPRNRRAIANVHLGRPDHLEVHHMPRRQLVRGRFPVDTGRVQRARSFPTGQQRFGHFFSPTTTTTTTTATATTTRRPRGSSCSRVVLLGDGRGVRVQTSAHDRLHEVQVVRVFVAEAAVDGVGRAHKTNPAQEVEKLPSHLLDHGQVVHAQKVRLQELCLFGAAEALRRFPLVERLQQRQVVRLHHHQRPLGLVRELALVEGRHEGGAVRQAGGDGQHRADAPHNGTEHDHLADASVHGQRCKSEIKKWQTSQKKRNNRPVRKKKLTDQSEKRNNRPVRKKKRQTRQK